LITEVLTRWDEVDALAPRWNELLHFEPRDGFFRSWTWYRAWMRHIRPDAEPFVVVLRESGRVVGIAPLCRLKYRDLGFSLTAVCWGGREVVSGDFLGPICDPASRDRAHAAILDTLWRLKSKWSLLVLGEMIEDADAIRHLQSLAEQNGAPTRLQEARICPYIALPATFDEYLGRLGTSTRYHIRRRMRDVEKRGAVVEVSSTPDELNKGLQALIDLHLARWNKSGQPGTLGRPGFRAFLQEVFRTLPEGVSCRLYQLKHDGATVAALLTFAFGESVLYYQAGWDPDSALSALSPAVVLMARSIQDAIASSFQYYEFLRGDEAYKSRWTTTSRQTTTLLIANAVAAKTYVQVGHIKDRVKCLVQRNPPTSEGSPINVAHGTLRDM
jgi:CelD/BcsL family acetyltransferase involved in cellulose biosynthesis